MAIEMSVKELARKQAAGEPVLLLDVRQADEHAFAALPGSRHIPLHELPQRWEEIETRAGTPLVVYCHHGIRSRRAADFLIQCGLSGVVSLAGGIDAWSLEVDAKVPRY